MEVPPRQWDTPPCLLLLLVILSWAADWQSRGHGFEKWCEQCGGQLGFHLKSSNLWPDANR